MTAYPPRRERTDSATEPLAIDRSESLRISPDNENDCLPAGAGDRID